MIIYIDNPYLHSELNKVGYFIDFLDGNPILKLISGLQPTAQDETDVNAFIATFDPIPLAKIEKINELKIEGLRRANLVYDDEDIVFPSIATIELLTDIDSTYTRSGVIAARLISVNTVINTFKLVRITINAMTILADIQNYNVTTTPAW